MLSISIADWGVREAPMMVAFRYDNLSQTDGTMASSSSGVASFLVGILGGLVWILRSEKSVAVPSAIPEID
jgi:hypothetical protein